MVQVNSQIKSDVEGKDNRLPVTVLSGFLGSGKTTLLKHLLESKTHGLRFAMIVNDMNELNIDARLIKKSSSSLSQLQERLVEMQNGCICCTLREDLLVEIKRLAQMEPRQYDYLLIESTGVSEPMPIAETFTFGELEPHAHEEGEEERSEREPDDGDRMDVDQAVATLEDVARLDTMVTVVDAQTFQEHMDSTKMLSDRFPSEKVTEEDDRTVADLLIDQIEFANVILLNKVDKVKKKALDKIEAIVRHLNPNAKIIRTKFSKVDPKELINTNSFSLDEATLMPGWLHQIRGQEKPETLEYGISSWVYRRRRPFHPARVPRVIEKIGSLGIIRSKGFIWIATYNDFCVEWSGTSKMINMTDGGNWYAVIPEEDWELPNKDEVKSDFEGEHGDRRQELVLITNAIARQKKVEQLLDSALLTDEEMRLGPEGWENFEDPLELQIGGEEEEEEEDENDGEECDIDDPIDEDN